MIYANSDVSEWVVLIIDDDPDNLDVAEQTLDFYGATVHIAQDGASGLTMIPTVKPNLVITDISMPEVDGWAVLARIRAMPDFATIPIIALTAHAMVGDSERGLEAGFDGYLTKPFNMETIITDIQACLKSQD